MCGGCKHAQSPNLHKKTFKNRQNNTESGGMSSLNWGGGHYLLEEGCKIITASADDNESTRVRMFTGDAGWWNWIDYVAYPGYHAGPSISPQLSCYC